MRGLHRAPYRCPYLSRTNGCPGGGIGRRAGFRDLWPQGRGSSSLLLGTNSFMSITQFMPNGTIHLYRDDLPEAFALGPVVAVDTETMGLNPHRDRLCLVQM